MSSLEKRRPRCGVEFSFDFDELERGFVTQQVNNGEEAPLSSRCWSESAGDSVGVGLIPPHSKPLVSLSTKDKTATKSASENDVIQSMLFPSLFLTLSYLQSRSRQNKF
ncbi:hypothetical protein L596_005353 [Steinernema carpocapsae]|uniref:Uncharacterized protein n=1 Tax=Steinernema carpocapsae TaxID=34508 RepID=A0A4U8UYR6_STECR|nr:hypothetical protein L596_005353 [Steinernema carpocapsae]